MLGRSRLLPQVHFASPEPNLLTSSYQSEASSTLPEQVMRAAVREEIRSGVALTAHTQTGRAVEIRLEFVAPGVVRVLLGDGKPPGNRTRLARTEADDVPEASLQPSDNQMLLQSSLLTVRIRLDPFHLSFCGSDGTILLEQNSTETLVTGEPLTLPFGFSSLGATRLAFHDTFSVRADEHFYGFGEKFTDLDKRGQYLEMWNYDAYGVHTERAYKNVPFFLSTRSYGVFVDSTSCSTFDVASNSNATLTMIVPDEALDYYVITGPDPKTIITRYAALVGQPILPPKWAFGLWMSSSFQHDSAEGVLERARQLREHHIPCDVLHLDAHWQYWGHCSDLVWNREAFPDPEAMIRQVHDLNFRVCLWINPYLSKESERFVEATERGFLLRTPRGEPYVVDLWRGIHPPVGIIDMTNPDAVSWFQELLRTLLHMGVDVFKTDFGEGVPADAVSFSGQTGAMLHNLYALLYNDAVSRVTAEETGRAGLVWGRSTFAGGQRHGAQWAGDPNCTPHAFAATLRGGLSLAMCGHPLWSHDVGGFHGTPTSELYVRWAQFGLFSPLCRAHGETSRLPWDFGEEALRIVREYLHLRYHLIPYIYTYAATAAATSVPLLRPMVLEYPDDPSTYSLDSQYMFGSEFLVAPIAEGYNRSVYFPSGKWLDYWSHDVIEGPQFLRIKASLERLPLFVRADALIPTIAPSQFLREEPFDPVTFHGYLFAKASFELQDVDGTTQVSAAVSGRQLHIMVNGAKRSVGIRLIPTAEVKAMEEVYVNGSLVRPMPNLQLGQHDVQGWRRNDRGEIEIVAF